MTFKTALELFEAAQTTAQDSDDPLQAQIAAGLAELTRAIRSELTRQKSELEAIKRRQS